MSDQYRKMKGKAGTGVESIADESTSPLLSGPSSPSRKPPPDWCFTTYIIFYLLGVGHLLPWNFFITAKAVSVGDLICLLCLLVLISSTQMLFDVSAVTVASIELPIVLLGSVEFYIIAKINH